MNFDNEILRVVSEQLCHLVLAHIKVSSYKTEYFFFMRFSQNSKQAVIMISY